MQLKFLDETTEVEVLDEIQSLRSKSAAGMYGIKSIHVKQLTNFENSCNRSNIQIR